MTYPIRILSTKVLRPENRELACKAHCQLDCVPFIRIEYLSLPIVETVRAPGTAIFTSVNAVNAYCVLEAASRPAIDQAFCIAGATEAALKEHLPTVQIRASRSYAAELVQDIIKMAYASPLHFFCGDRRMPTIPEGLDQAGIVYEEHVVYRTLLRPEVLEEHYDGILFFSPSAVESFFSRQQWPEGSRAFAIGHTTAAALSPYVPEVAIAPRTEEQALLKYAIEYCKEHKGLI